MMAQSWGDTATLDAKALGSYADNAHKLQGGGIGSFLLNIIPTTSFDALSRNDVLQVLFFAIIFGTSLALVGAWEGDLDRAQARRVLDGNEVVDVTAG